MDAEADWPGLATLVCQQTKRWVAGQVQQATHYFRCSLAGASAATLASYIRGHWGIENQQHWHLDMCDVCRRCQLVPLRPRPRNLSTMRKLALTLLQRAPQPVSLKCKRNKTAHDDGFFHQLLAQLPGEEQTPIS